MVITIQGRQVRCVEFSRGGIDLDKNNPRRCKCKDCGKAMERGEGVHRQARRKNGYICFLCLAADLKIRTHDTGFEDNDAGFHFTDFPQVISQCYTGYPPRVIKTFDLLMAVRAEWKYEIVERAAEAMR